MNHEATISSIENGVIELNLDMLIKQHHQEKAAEAEIFELSGAMVSGPTTKADAPDERLAALRTGLTALDDMVEASDVVQFFLSLIRAQGGRLLLLRQWTTGLRVMLAEGIQLPERMLDQKAANPRVIPLRDDDIFNVVAEEKVIYSGPFPRENFSRELSRELGGDENRPILVIPLPLRGRWGTFLYIDWIDFMADDRIIEATLLARYAVLRLHCVEEGLLSIGSHTQEILSRERGRQRERVKAGYEDLKPGDITPEAIYQKVGELTAMPQVAGHILRMLNDPSTTALQLEKEIVKDLVLTTKILRISNSSFYESVSEVKTIRDAIVRLGFNSVRNWTLVNASQTAFPGVSSDSVMHRIWVQSIRSAYGAQLVADEVGYGDREIVFVGGLIQNIGQLIMARALPGLFEKMEEIAREQDKPLWKVEQERLGYDHGALGALLIKAWNLSDDVAKGVRYHHDLVNDQDPNHMAAMIALGEEAATCVGEEDEQRVQEVWEVSEAARILAVDWPVFHSIWERVGLAETDACL